MRYLRSFRLSALFPHAHPLAATSLLLRGAVSAAASEFRQYLGLAQAENREEIEQWLAVHER